MRFVVKIGSAIISQKGGGLDRSAIKRLCRQIGELHQSNHEIIVVTSGAIAAGVGRLGWQGTQDLRFKQSAAAVGQLILMEAYEAGFKKAKIIPAQILLTREDLLDRQRYLNIRNTLMNLLTLKIIPIINENDSVSTDEIQFGDNDTLSAVVATKVGADRLIILSDVPGLYEKGFEKKKIKNIIPVVEKITPELEKSISNKKGSALSVGGMQAKIRAAKMATSSGIETWIASGRKPGVLAAIAAQKQNAGTQFLSKNVKVDSRQAWIAFGRNPKGAVIIDDGAKAAVIDNRKSLLPKGIKSIKGSFAVGDTVSVKSSDGVEIARGLVNFSSVEVQKIRGHHSDEVQNILGRSGAASVIHRDNLVLL